MKQEEHDIEQGELFEHYRFEANPGQEPLRIDKYLMNFVENATRNKIQNAAKAGNVLVNDQPVKPNYKVKGGDVIRVVFAQPPRTNEIVPENIPLNIVYEDDDVIVVDKEPGMVVHPGHGNYTGTLVNALAYHFDNLPTKNGLDRPGMVHRIDKDTSGLLVLAKTEYAMAHLAKQFHDRTTTRRYNALVWGNFEEEEGTYTGNIGRNLSNRMQMAVYDEEGDFGKPAITHYKVLERFGYVTFVECRLETGRTHQIRAHFKHFGHTLFNDARYGGDDILKGTTFTNYKQFVQNCFKVLPRQALHARTLGFTHPVSGKFLEFESPVPDDMMAALEKWRVYSENRIKGK